MGGQACVLFGAAEFSYDSDFAILCEPENLENLKAAFQDLQATRVYVPPLEIEYLERGHGVHFRCEHPDCAGMRVDVMAKMRGVDPFPVLWERRTTFESDDGESYDTLAITDLVNAKKTQRDKDWPMIARLVRTHYYEHRQRANAAQIEFWLRRTARRTFAARSVRPVFHCGPAFHARGGRSCAHSGYRPNHRSRIARGTSAPTPVRSRVLATATRRIAKASS